MRIPYRSLCYILSWTAMLTALSFIWDERLFQILGQFGTPSSPKPTIHITTVVCAIRRNTTPREEAAVLIKSAIISAMLYKVQSLKFHLFLEHMDSDSDFFLNKLQEFGNPFKGLEVKMTFYSVDYYMPNEYKYLLYYPSMLRCTYAKLHLSTALSQLDAVMYLDNDFIITGNVAKLWAQFDEMNEHQAIGMAPDSEPGTEHRSDQFVNLPYPPPKGLNGGLLLMNLTKIRTKDVKWQERLQMLSKKFEKTKKRLNDQQLLNIFLYYYPDLLKLVPCQFNFFFVHCTFGLHCKAAEEDPYGIQALHGAYYNFEAKKESKKKMDGSFRGIFLAYKNINLTRANLDLKRDLMEPIRLMHTLPAGANSTEKSYLYNCIGTIDKLLFKNYFVKNDSTEHI